MDTYKTKCANCESPVYYYPVQLLLESKKMPVPVTDKTPATKIVSCSCTGEKGGVKHTSDYIFPKDFQKL